MVNVKPEQFQKIWSALITPTNEDESVNYEALERIVELQIQDGAEGFYCCGSSGEGLLLTLEERKQVLEHVLKAADGRVPVISHVGTIRTRDVVDLARHAMSAGALAVSMIPPYYYKFSMDEIMGYYEDVIRAIPDVPAIVYNIPQFTGVEFSKENAAGAPSVSLWVTSLLMQLALLLVYFSNNAWSMMLSITGVMVLPAYLISMLFLWKTCEDGQYPQKAPTGRAAALACAALGTLYGFWLIYAAGLHYMLMAMVLIALGIPVYIWSRKQHPDQTPLFKNYEKVILVLLVLAALVAIYLFARGIITL